MLEKKLKLVAISLLAYFALCNPCLANLKDRLNVKGKYFLTKLDPETLEKDKLDIYLFPRPVSTKSSILKNTLTAVVDIATALLTAQISNTQGLIEREYFIKKHPKSLELWSNKETLVCKASLIRELSDLEYLNRLNVKRVSLNTEKKYKFQHYQMSKNCFNNDKKLYIKVLINEDPNEELFLKLRND